MSDKDRELLLKKASDFGKLGGSKDLSKMTNEELEKYVDTMTKTFQEAFSEETTDLDEGDDY